MWYLRICTIQGHTVHNGNRRSVGGIHHATNLTGPLYIKGRTNNTKKLEFFYFFYFSEQITANANQNYITKKGWEIYSTWSMQSRYPVNDIPPNKTIDEQKSAFNTQQNKNIQRYFFPGKTKQAL